MINQSLWQTLFAALLVLAVLLILIITAFYRIIRPIWVMARHVHRHTAIQPQPIAAVVPSTWNEHFIDAADRFVVEKIFLPLGQRIVQLIEAPRDDIDDPMLPYGDRTDEIGALAQGFNAMLEKEHRLAEQDKQRALDWHNGLRYVAHEIKNGVQKLLGESSEERREIVLHRIKAIIDGLSDKTGPEYVHIECRKIDVAVFLSQVCKDADLYLAKDLVTYHGPSSGLYCKIDPHILDLTVENILENANRHRTPGTVITLSLSRTAREEVEIDIANVGTHIPEEFLERIFDKGFTTLSQSENGELQGQGIGLYSARVYVNRMDGRITAMNQPTGPVFKMAFASLQDG